MKKLVAGVAASSAIVFGLVILYVLSDSTEASQRGHSRRMQSSLTSVEDIIWIDNFRQAIAEGKRSGKPIFLAFRCAP